MRAISSACSQSFSARQTARRTVSTSVFARLSGVIISSSCQASIGSPIWRKPAAVFRWSLVGLRHCADFLFGNSTSNSVRLGSGSMDILASVPSMTGNLPVFFVSSTAAAATSAAPSG